MRNATIIEAAPAVEAPVAKTIGLSCYYPEMGQAKPAHDMFASLAHYGRHYYVYTDIELKGRGITAKETSGGRGFTKCFKCTMLAFKKLKTQYAIANEVLLS